MKLFLSLAVLAALSTSVIAAEARCNLSHGNWMNAATISCAKSDNGAANPPPPPPKCEKSK